MNKQIYKSFDEALDASFAAEHGSEELLSVTAFLRKAQAVPSRFLRELREEHNPTGSKTWDALLEQLEPTFNLFRSGYDYKAQEAMDRSAMREVVKENIQGLPEENTPRKQTRKLLVFDARDVEENPETAKLRLICNLIYDEQSQHLDTQEDYNRWVEVVLGKPLLVSHEMTGETVGFLRVLQVTDRVEKKGEWLFGER